MSTRRAPTGSPVNTINSARYVARQSERSFQNQVLALASLRGYLTYHTHDSRRSEPGFPDVCLVKVKGDGFGRLVFLELKAVGGTVSPEQRCWIESLAAVPGVVAQVVTPEDWSLIEYILV